MHFIAVALRRKIDQAGHHWIKCTGRWGGGPGPMTFANLMAAGQALWPFVIAQTSGLSLPPHSFADVIAAPETPARRRHLPCSQTLRCCNVQIWTLCSDQNMEGVMRIARLETKPEGLPGLSLAEIRPKDRARVSGPGLRAFRVIADRWGLDEAQRRTLLGEPPRSTYHAWMKKAADGAGPTLPLDTLLRISAVLGVHKALTILFVHGTEAMIWLKGPHGGLPFAGRAPMDVMLDGTQDGILTVRRHLDGWRGGLRGAPDAGSGKAPVRPEDIVWA
jgi:hypothetical protein